MDVNDLITSGRAIEHGLKLAPPARGVYRSYELYKPENIDEYFKWKERSIRFLELYCPVDKDRFVDYSGKFERHYSPRFISNMIGVLEACKTMPSEKMVKMNETTQRISEIAKVEELEQTYLRQTSEDGIHLSSNAFHQWHAAACVLFDKWCYPSDDDWVKFQNVNGTGEGFTLKGEYDKVYSPYRKLIERLKDGRGIKGFIPHKSLIHNTNNKPSNKINIFISYSHADVKWLERLKIHLKVLTKYSDSVEYWEDTKLRGGDKWREEIEKAINKANVAVLLISTSFLASDFISNNELPTLLCKAEQDGTRILPLIVSPCAYELSELSGFQAINSPDKTLSDMKDDEAAIERVYLELVNNIR